VDKGEWLCFKHKFFDMPYLQISSSYYIFKQDISLGIIGIVLCLLLTGFAFYRFNKRADYESKRRAKREMIWSVFAAIGFWLFVFMPLMRNALNLRNNPVETVGQTIEWVDDGDSKRVRYKFVVDGETYIDIIGIVYGGETIEHINCPGGAYYVIYEKDNPENAVMDFKRPKQ
jgi:hypothetical protein